MTTTRQGWRSALDLCLLVFTVVVCGSLPLLALSSALSLVREPAPSRDVRLRHSSGLPASDVPADGSDVDDNDDDSSDDDDAGALPGHTLRLSAHRDFTHLLAEIRIEAPLSVQSDSVALRGPPRPTQDKRIRPSLLCLFGRIAPPPSWQATDSSRAPQDSSSDPQDADDNDFDDRDDDDDDDDDDGDADGGDLSALPASSTVLTAGHACAGCLNVATFDAPSLIGLEAHSLRGPPWKIHADRTTSLHRITPRTPSFSSAPRGQWLRAPPHASARFTTQGREDTRARAGGAERTALRSTSCLHKLATSRARRFIATASRRT